MSQSDISVTVLMDEKHIAYVARRLALAVAEQSLTWGQVENLSDGAIIAGSWADIKCSKCGQLGDASPCQSCMAESWGIVTQEEYEQQEASRASSPAVPSDGIVDLRRVEMTDGELLPDEFRAWRERKPEHNGDFRTGFAAACHFYREVVNYVAQTAYTRGWVKCKESSQQELDRQASDAHISPSRAVYRDMENTIPTPRINTRGLEILDDLKIAGWAASLSAEKLFDAMVERIEEPGVLGTEDPEMKAILCEVADRLGGQEKEQPSINFQEVRDLILGAATALEASWAPGPISRLRALADYFPLLRQASDAVEKERERIATDLEQTILEAPRNRRRVAIENYIDQLRGQSK